MNRTIYLRGKDTINKNATVDVLCCVAMVTAPQRVQNQRQG